MDQNETQWKQKYLTSLDKYEKKEKSWKELEDMLRLAMNRVALAAEGVDSKLDKQLKSLRKSIKSNSYPGLESIVEDISKSVKRLDDLRNDSEQIDTRPVALLLTLVESLKFPKSLKKPSKALIKKLKSADPDQPIDEELRELADLINETIAVVTPAELATTKQGKGILGRFFGSQPAQQSSDAGYASSNIALATLNELLTNLKQTESNRYDIVRLQSQLQQSADEVSITRIAQEIAGLYTDRQDMSSTIHQAERPSDDEVAQQHPSSTVRSPQENSTEQSQQANIAIFCLQLIESLQLPEEFSEEVISLRNKIVKGIGLKESTILLKQIADLITSTRSKVEKEKQELQDFLHQLTDRLKDIDKHIAGAETKSKESYSSSKNFGDEVEVQMKGLETSVQDASELNQLKQSVQTRLDAIRNHILTYQKDEEKSHRELLNELAETNSRLRETEVEANLLRTRLTEEHAQAIHDALTGIYNRLAYEERIEQEFNRWKRYKKPLVLIVLDVDHFKKINDTYGHSAGDKALKLIAQTLQKNLRETDFLARYGGEEFVILMPETDIESAMGVANKLRETIEAVKFNYQEKAVNITVSCGASQFQKGDKPETVFHRADTSLYHAKQNGRNQCYTQDNVA